jgi:hypothetical protein
MREKANAPHILNPDAPIDTYLPFTQASKTIVKNNSYYRNKTKGQMPIYTFKIAKKTENHPHQGRGTAPKRGFLRKLGLFFE